MGVSEQSIPVGRSFVSLYSNSPSLFNDSVTEVLLLLYAALEQY